MFCMPDTAKEIVWLVFSLKKYLLDNPATFTKVQEAVRSKLGITMTADGEAKAATNGNGTPAPAAVPAAKKLSVKPA